MVEKPTYEELEQMVNDFEKQSVEWKQTERKLQESRKRYSTLSEASFEGILLHDKGIILDTNKRFAEMYGYDLGELIGKDALELIPPDYRNTVRSHIASGYEGPYEVFGLRKDSSTFQTEIRARHMMSDGRNLRVAVVRDITEHKQAEESLRNSEERYKSFFKNNHSVMLLIDPERGDIVDANPAAISYYGWNHEELTSQKITNINTLTEEQVFQEMEQAKKEHRRHFYFQHVLANGDIRDVEVYSGPIQLQGQQLLYSIIYDVTDRKQAGEELKESEDLLKATLESTADGILVVDEKGQVIHTNSRFAEMWRIPNDLIKSRDDEKLLSYVLDQFVEPKTFLSKVQELYKTAKEDFETLFFKDGRIFERYSRPLIRSGKIAGRVWSFRDATERNRVQEALRESEEKYRVLTENSLTGIFIHQDQKLVFTNDRFAEIHGYTPDELLGMEYLTLVHPDESEVVAQRVAKRLKGDYVPQQYEVRRIRKDGTTIWCEMMATSIEYQGRPAVMGNLIDITNRKQAEELLLYSKERYQALSNATFESVFLFEKDICTDANKIATDMFGYDLDELIGTFATKIIAPESKELVKHNMLSGYEEPYESLAQRKDGTTFHAEIRGKMTKYKDKGVRVIVLRDIDDRKRAEEILCKTYDELEDKVRERTAELEKSKSKLIKEINEHKKTEKKLRKREKELENKTNDLEELNAALRVLLNKREEDKITLQDNILSNVKALIEPYVVKLKQYSLPQGQETLINILESNLNEIVSPFTRKLSSKFFNLSPAEIQVANLVKFGKTNKEIAEMLQVAQRTIAFHRENIRKKLGIKNQKTNLKTYLMSLD